MRYLQTHGYRIFLSYDFHLLHFLSAKYNES